MLTNSLDTARIAALSNEDGMPVIVVNIQYGYEGQVDGTQLTLRK